MIKRRVSRRDFLSLSGVTAAGAILAACGPAPAPGAASDEGDMPAAEGYTVVYTYPHPDTNMLGGNQRLILERYDSVVPGTDIQVELKTGYEMSRVQADLAAGTAPDLFWTGYGAVIKAIEEGLIVNQQEYMEASGVDFDDFVDGIEAIYAPQDRWRLLLGHALRTGRCALCLQYRCSGRIPALNHRQRIGPGTTSSNGVSQSPATLTASAPMKMALTPTRLTSGASPYWQAFRYPGISALDSRPTLR